MLLKRLKLKDFRQFKGEQSIEFSIDLEKNVTVIMGENGSGKTTLAQAFTWCLYGDTDFDDKSMICKATSQSMLPSDSDTVRVELYLNHNGIDYVCIREQRYSKDANGNLKRPNQSVFKIAYKGKDGQKEFVPSNETELRMKEILPKELSKYFFFDGERIGNMSKEIKRGKSQEFAQAVRGLLGLSAFQSALDHLNGRPPKVSVIRSYNESFDSKSNSKIAQYTREIAKLEEVILNIEERLSAIHVEQEIANEKCKKLEEQIRQNKESEELARERDNLKEKIGELKSKIFSSEQSALTSFSRNAHSFFAKKLMKDALVELSDTDKIDKGIPYIHSDTIEFLIKRKKCICGEKIEFGNHAYKHLNDLLEYIPPQSIGTYISQFVRECELRCKSGDALFDDIATKCSFIRDFENNIDSNMSRIQNINQRLVGMQNVGQLQCELNRFIKALSRLSTEEAELNRRIGSLGKEKERKETERNELTLKDENNRRIEQYKAYAQYMFDSLRLLYYTKETETRTQLERVVNDIFKTIYNGGFSLSIDEKYNIQVVVNDYNGFNEDIETSTAQSISVILAFIAGVIKMARQSRNPENEMLVSEPYPLVMDAPLSAFDKKRISTVCDVLPNIAEQVIIFIKDTDGELAETFMGEKVGLRYQFKKENEFETYLKKR